MAERLRRRQDDDCAARSADPSLRNHRDRKRELALQAPRLSRCTAPACPGGQTGTSRAALRRTRGGHSAPRGSLLFATGTSLNRRPRGVTIGRRSGVKLQRRLTVNAIFYIAQSGCQWRMLPKDFPPFTTVQHYFYPWRDNGLWRQINHVLLMLAREAVGREASPSAGVIDSQSVKTTEAGGPRGYDASKKIKGRKRHIVTDTCGLLVGAEVHP